MFNLIEKIIDKIIVNLNFLNHNNSPSYKQNQNNLSGDNVGRDKITNYFNGTEENLNLKLKIKDSEEKLNSFRNISNYFKKIGVLRYIEAGVNFNITTTPMSATISPKNNYTVWQNIIIITTRPVELTKLSFLKNGNTHNDDFKNFKLYIDGYLVQEIEGSDIENYITFDLMFNPVRLKTGTRIMELIADVNKSAISKFFNFSLVADKVVFIDSVTHTKIEPVYNGKEFKEITSGEQTVN